MDTFLRRSLSGLVYVVLYTSAILFSKESYIMLTSAFGLICIWEFSRLIDNKSYTSYLLFIGFSILVSLYELNEQITLVLLTVSLTGSLQVLYHLFSNNTSFPKNLFQKEDLSIRYIVLSFSFLLLLPFSNGVYEPYILIYLLLLIWSNDSFAYLVGKNFGKRKLFERVSPKKTIEGFVGGGIFTILTGIILSYYSNLFSMMHWIVLSIIISLLGTMGDLVESKFKRQAKIKDSGKIMPGHGGLLDRLDSLLFLAPFVYLYIHYII